MRQIADFHIHSKYSRACSKDLELVNIDATCRRKGIDIIGTGDFTYPEWFKSINEELEEVKPHPSPLLKKERGNDSGSLYGLKSRDDDNVKFTLTTEVALIYKKFDKCRRVHIVAHAPNVQAVKELNEFLDKDFNIRSDGRPILGMSIEDFCGLCFSIHPKFLIYPAHIWTPWFAIFGSKSGFNTWEDAFGEYADKIYAYETGLSSDPEMNWRLSALDKFTLLSNSDAHSLPNLAREANVFNLEEISYNEIYNVIKNKSAAPPVIARGEASWQSRDSRDVHGIATPSARNDKLGMSYLDYTIEFYPEEGMYHIDGHRDCKFSCLPAESKKLKGLCPKCKKPLILGVDYRVSELADRPPYAKASEGEASSDKDILNKPVGMPGFKKLVELDKIIAESMGIKSRKSKKVQSEYNRLLDALGKELDILLDMPIDNIKEAGNKTIAEGIKRIREGKLMVEPGFDGQYGIVKIFKDSEKLSAKQIKLL